MQIEVKHPEQLIFFGAPGTGKSYRIDSLAQGLKQFRVTIHPEFSYSDFAGQLLPRADASGNVIFDFVPGPFTDALAYAFRNRDENVVLILEELSRGNAAAIFGDLFQLLDRDDTGNSAYPVHNPQIAECLPEIEENIANRTPEAVFLPANLSILASVNTSDQNVMPMDTAFKRRFDWCYVSTKPIRDSTSGNKYVNNPKILLPEENGHCETSWVELYQSLNRYILSGDSPLGSNEDKQVGHFFIKFDQDLIERSLADEQEAQSEVLKLLADKLLMYLWEDVEGRNGLAGSGEKRLFKRSITSYGELNSKAGSSQVFSNYFLGSYLHKGPPVV